MKQPEKAELTGAGAGPNLVLYRIILYVQNVQALKKFYRDTLGLSVVEEIEDSWVVLKAGQCELALHVVGEAFRVPSRRSSERHSNAKLVLGFRGDLAELRERLIASGVPMREIKSYSGVSGPLCDGTDPEGNVFQLAQV